MRSSRISRSHICNIHTDQQVTSICLWPDCYRPVLCQECQKDQDIHPSTHIKVLPLEEFLTKVDEFNSRRNSAQLENQIVGNIQATAEKYRESVDNFERSIKNEKKLIDQSVNELLECLVDKCHRFKHELFEKLDNQLATFKKNYKNLVKSTKNLPPVEIDLGRASSFEAVNKSASYDQIDGLVRSFRKEITTKMIDPKEIDPNLTELHKIAQSLQNNNENPSTTVLANNKVDVIRPKLLEVFDKFFDKLSKVHHENAPILFQTGNSESTIIKDQKEFVLLRDFLSRDFREPVFDLIYRGSRDGFTAKNFYSKCSKKGPTMIVIQTVQGKKFGGYTDVDWVADDEYKNTTKSFLFSLDLKEKYLIKGDHNQYAIKGSKSLGPCFGGGHDLRISNDFKLEDCSGYIGFSYDAKGHFAKDVYGDTSFFVADMEVFKIVEGEEEEDDKTERERHQELLFQSEGEQEEEEDAPIPIWELIKRNENTENSPVNDNSGGWERIERDEVIEEQKEEPDRDNGPSSISNLITGGQLSMIMDWIDPNGNITFEFIYKGSKNGFKAEVFHRRCDRQGPTLTLVKSQSGQVFGGFTKQSWDTSDQPAYCADTFLFSATKGKKFTPINPGGAIFRSSNAGPVFGQGDLYICSDCNKNEESFSNLGNGFAADIKNPYTFFAGEQIFLVEEMEVFKVIFFE